MAFEGSAAGLLRGFFTPDLATVLPTARSIRWLERLAVLLSRPVGMGDEWELGRGWRLWNRREGNAGALVDVLTPASSWTLTCPGAAQAERRCP